VSTVTTSHYAIFDYWKTKHIDKLGNVTDDGDVRIVHDWGEPCCWGCGKIIEGVDKDPNYEEWLKQSDFKRIWNHKATKHELNRCHIFPGAMGGKDEPENLFLLCPECHALSPDTSNPNNFFRWVFKRRKEMIMGDMSPESFMKQVDECLEQQGLPCSMNIINLMASQGSERDKERYLNGNQTIKEYVYPRTSVHCTGFVDSTKVSVLAEWFRSMYLDAILTVKEGC